MAIAHSAALLSWTRMVLAPIWAIVFHYSTVRDWSVWVVFWIAFVALITDTLDGPLARRSGRASPVGQILDSTADVVFRYTVLLGLLSEGTVSLWLLIALLYFDCSVTALKTIHAYQFGMRERGWWGKVISTILSSTVLILLLGRACGWPTGEHEVPIWSNAILFMAILLNVFLGTAELQSMKRRAQ